MNEATKQLFGNWGKNRNESIERPEVRATSAVRIFAYIFAAAIPIITKIYLNAPIGVVAIGFLAFPITAIGFAARLNREGMGWIRYVSMLINAGAGILILIGIVITPVSAYTSWFESFKFGTPDGGISNLFVIITGFFSSVLSPTVLTMGVAWPIIMVAFTLLYLLAIVVQSQTYLLLVLAFLIIPAGYITYRSVTHVRREGAFAFTLALLGVAFVISVAVPKFETPPGDDYVNDQLYPLLRSAVVDAIPRFPLLYAVPGYGIRFDEKHLGGTPTLLPNPIFTVTGKPSEVLYLRSRIFDTYDGTSWSMSSYFSGRATDALRSQFFGDASQRRNDDLRIEITAKNFGFLPYTLDSKMIIVERGFPRISEGSKDTGFKLRNSLQQNDVVFLRRSDPDDPLTEEISEVERLLYGQIPDDLPSELNVIADGLSDGIDDHEQILANIEAFLALNYTYSLEVEEFGPVFSGSDAGYDDFVYSFLFSEAGGYCVQFATSFIILARLNDIPARYATGYLAYTPADGTPAQVSGLSAHAWPEVWLPTRGWVNWEATPAANLANYTNIGDNWTFSFAADPGSATSRQIEGLVGASFSDADDGSDTGGRRWIRIALFVLAGLSGLVAFGGVILLSVRAVQYFGRDESAMFFHHAKRLSRSLARKGISLPQQIGWDEWFRAVDSRVPMSNGELSSMRSLIMRLTYNDDEVTSDHCDEIAIFRKYVQKNVR